MSSTVHEQNLSRLMQKYEDKLFKAQLVNATLTLENTELLKQIEELKTKNFDLLNQVYKKDS